MICKMDHLTPSEQQYLAQLSDMEKLVLHIAADHLESSFSLRKSIGYQGWLKKQKSS